jgi:hypothetical protein
MGIRFGLPSVLGFCLALGSQGPHHVTPAPQGGPDGRMLYWAGTEPVKYYIQPVRFGSFEPAVVKQAADEAFRLWREIAPTRVPLFEFAPTTPELDAQMTLGNDAQRYFALLSLKERRSVFIVYDAQDAIGTFFNIVRGASADGMPNTAGTSYDVGVISFPPLGSDSQNPPIRSVEYFRFAMFHEVGHVLGLADGRLNTRGELVGGRYGQHPSMMFPLGIDYSETFHPSEQAWLKYVYSQGRELPDDTGSIEGIANDAQGNPLRAVNMVAEKIPPPGSPNATTLRFSAVSDYNGVAGRFVIAVQPGRYRVFADSIVSRINIPPFLPNQDLSEIGPKIRRPNGVFAPLRLHGDLPEQWFEPTEIEVGARERKTVRLQLAPSVAPGTSTRHFSIPHRSLQH